MWETSAMTRGPRHSATAIGQASGGERTDVKVDVAAYETPLERAQALSSTLSDGGGAQSEPSGSEPKRRFGLKFVAWYTAALVGMYLVGYGVMIALTNQVH